MINDFTKTIKFTPELTQLIKQGKKTTTFRLFDDKDLTEGDSVILATRDGEKVTNFAHAKLIKVYTKLLKVLDKTDYIGHEHKIETSVEDYKKYYGDKVTENTEVKVIRFSIVSFI